MSKTFQKASLMKTCKTFSNNSEKLKTLKFSLKKVKPCMLLFVIKLQIVPLRLKRVYMDKLLKESNSM